MNLKSTNQSLFFFTFVYVIGTSLTSLTDVSILRAIIRLLTIGVVAFLYHKSYLGKSIPQDYTITYKWKNSIAYLLLPLFLLLVLGASTLSTSFFTLLHLEEGTADYGTSFIGAFLLYALLPAFQEELFCRYYFLRSLTPYNPVGAVLTSALFFAFLHGSFEQFLHAFVAGVFLGALTFLLQSVVPAMLFHLCNNTIALLMAFYPEIFSTGRCFLVLGIFSLLGLVFFIVFQKHFKQTIKAFLFSDGGYTTKTLLLSVVKSPLILFLGFFIFESILRLCS